MEGQSTDLGPIDVAVIGYPPGAPMTGEAMPLLLDRGIVRVLDVLFVVKEPDGSDPIHQLKELAALRDQGVLTEEEFAAQKARLLG